MARSWFGGTSADQVVTKYRLGNRSLTAIAIGQRVTFWDAETGGTQHTDLLIDGTTPADSVVSDDYGYLPRFQGPDPATTMWADLGDGTPRRLVVTTDGAIAAAEDLANKIDTVEKGAMGGVAELDELGKIVQPVPAAKLEGVVAQDNLPAHLAPADLSATYATATYIDAERYVPGRTDLEAIHAACAAATALTRGAVVRLSSRTWDVEGGLSMSGYTCGLEGLGPGHEDGGPTNPSGCVLHASTQTGAVLDMSGWLPPGSFRGKLPFGGFALRGDNTADPTKVKRGLYRDDAVVGLSSIYFHDIVISQTGGACVDLYTLYLSEMDRVVAVTPVDAKVNDVPYMVFRGCNGNTFSSLGFRSMTSSDDTGPSGALVTMHDGTWHMEQNLWLGTWFEFLHTPANGTLIHNAANMQQWIGTYFVDCSKESGATGTSYVRFAPSGITDLGANSWDGPVPGGASPADTGIDAGIVVSQSNNRIVGVRDRFTSNVVLEAGVHRTQVELGGTLGSPSATSGVVDNSGTDTNTWHDWTTRTGRVGRYLFDQQGASTAGPRFRTAATPANGSVYLGDTGVRVEAVGDTVYVSGAAINFRALDGTIRAQFSTGTTGAAATFTAATNRAGVQSSGFIHLTKGGLRRFLQTKTASYAMSWPDDDVIVANGSSITITLPSAVSAAAGRQYTVKNVNATACTIATVSSQTVDGVAPAALAQWESLTVMSDGANWVTV